MSGWERWVSEMLRPYLWSDTTWGPSEFKQRDVASCLPKYNVELSKTTDEDYQRLSKRQKLEPEDTEILQTKEDKMQSNPCKTTVEDETLVAEHGVETKNREKQQRYFQQSWMSCCKEDIFTQQLLRLLKQRGTLYNPYCRLHCKGNKFSEVDLPLTWCACL